MSWPCLGFCGAGLASSPRTLATAEDCDAEHVGEHGSSSKLVLSGATIVSPAVPACAVQPDLTDRVLTRVTALFPSVGSLLRSLCPPHLTTLPTGHGAPAVTSLW